MIDQVFNAMITALLAKFMLNDVPHAAGFYDAGSFKPETYKDMESLFHGVEDLKYGDALEWVEFWYPSTMPKRDIRLVTTTLWTLHGMWRKGLVKVEGDGFILKE